VAWIDTGGGVHVGPESMGSDPGPACYGKGGTAATVTDANLVLGFIDPNYYLGGEITLHVEKSIAAVDNLARRLGISRTEAADGIFRIINTNMLNGLRVVSVEKGHDPRHFSLLSFGGAGGCHCTAIIEELEIDRVIIPPTAAAFSAFGMLCTDLKHDFVSTIYKPVSEISVKELQRTVSAMEKAGTAAFPAAVRAKGDFWFEYSADMRYRGQGHDIRVDLAGPVSAITPGKIIERFNSEYMRTYGYLEDNQNIQLINLRTVACLGTEKPRLRKARSLTKVSSKAWIKGHRPVYFTELGKFTETAVYDGHKLKPGSKLAGPAIVELNTTTVVLRPGQSLKVDEYGNFIAARRGVKP
jgi:N-methylhydantoinase A